MTPQLQAEYKATIMQENLHELLRCILPQLTLEQERTVYTQKKDKPITAEGVVSHLECILLPNLQNPVLLLKQEGGMRGFIFEKQGGNYEGAIRIHELSSGMTREYYDLYNNPDCAEVFT